MGLTKITKAELKNWRDRYGASLRNFDLENETKHCTLFYRELKEFVDYIEERNQTDEEKKIGCVRIYFVRPEREFQPDADPTTKPNPDKTMKFVYNPFSVKKANSDGESYPQMRIAMVPMTGVRPDKNSKFAILEIYSEKDNDKEVMCLYPGTALRKNHIPEDIKIRKETRKLNKMTREIKKLNKTKAMTLDNLNTKIAQLDSELDHEEDILLQIIYAQDKNKPGPDEPNHQGEHKGLCPPGVGCDD